METVRKYFSQWMRGLQPLSNRNYRLFTIGNCVSLIGTWMQRIAVGWLAWTLSHSGVWLGLIAFADLFPTVLLSPLAGVLADRCDRKRILLITQVVGIVQAIALVVLTSLHLITVELLFALTLGLGISNAFNQPARLSWIPSLVDAPALRSAIAINSIAFNTARFIGPAIAGTAIFAWGVVAPFALNALSYAVFILTLWRIRTPDESHETKQQTNVWKEMFAGYRYAAQHPAIGPILLVLAISAFAVRGIPEMAPALAAIFQRGVGGFASLVTAIGLGALTGGFWMIGRDPSKDLAPLIIRHVLLLPITVLLVVGSKMFYVALPCFFMFGFSLVVTAIGAQTLIQSTVASDMRGRVLALYSVIYRGGPALSALWMGVLSSYVGIRVTFGVAAALCFVVWCLAKILSVGIPAPYRAPAATNG